MPCDFSQRGEKRDGGIQLTSTNEWQSSRRGWVGHAWSRAIVQSLVHTRHVVVRFLAQARAEEKKRRVHVKVCSLVTNMAVRGHRFKPSHRAWQQRSRPDVGLDSVWTLTAGSCSRNTRPFCLSLSRLSPPRLHPAARPPIAPPLFHRLPSKAPVSISSSSSPSSLCS